MATKMCNCATQNCHAPIAKHLFTPESTYLISASSELVEYVYWLKEKVGSLLLTEQKCNESNETTRAKISAFFSKEITELNLALKNDTAIGQ